MLELNSSFLWIFFLLWILYLTLNHIFFKPVGRIIAEREAKAEADYRCREKMMAEIEIRTRWLEDQLGRARKEARQRLEEWLQNGEKARTGVIAEARERSTQIMNEKLAVLENEIGTAESELETQIAAFSDKIRQAYL